MHPVKMTALIIRPKENYVRVSQDMGRATKVKPYRFLV